MEDNAAADDATFTAFVEVEIAPLVAVMQAANAVARRQLWLGVGIGGAIGLVIAIVIYVKATELDTLVLVGVILVGLVLGAIPGSTAIMKARQTFADAHISKIAAFLGLSYQPEGFSPPYFSMFREMGMLPKSDKQEFTALISGTRNGAPFAFYDAHLREWQTRRSGKTTTRQLVTVFQGQLLHTPYPRKFTSRTLIARDMGWFNVLGGFSAGDGMKRVGLADPVFEKIFEVYSTDQVESRYLLDPLFMERLKALEGRNKKRTLKAAFYKGALLVTLDGKGKYLPPLSGRDTSALVLAKKTRARFERLFALMDSLNHHRQGQSASGPRTTKPAPDNNWP
ncbi:MAG: hypothetical protein COA85_13975 [Robiginitomaculum sp.]|nr:MAG: hypothetical protein COA85_13975 [Robiginitomaculum sp.]